MKSSYLRVKYPVAAALAAMLLAPTAASASIILDFEGLGNIESVENFYNGGLGGSGSGPGANYGITFSSNYLALIDGDAGGSGNFGGEPSPSTVLFFSENTGFLNASVGFTNAFSFFYTSPSVTGMVTIYDGLNASGNILASAILPTTPFNGAPDPTGGYSPFVPFGVLFSGTARSIALGGAANQIAFDDLAFGSATGVPEPMTLSLLGAGLAGIGLTRRRRS